MPNFEEIWPSGKNKNKPSNRPDSGMDYVLEAMKLGIPGERNKDFTTMGKPRVTEALLCLKMTPKMSHHYFTGHSQPV